MLGVGFLSETGELVALGALSGAQVLIVCFSVLIGIAYRDRAVLAHAPVTLMGVLCLQSLVRQQTILAEVCMLLALGLAGLQLRELVSHAGAMRRPRLALNAVSIGLLPVMAAAAWLGQWHLLLPGLGIWAAVVLVIMLRTWAQSQPWCWWLLSGQLILVCSAGWLGWRAIEPRADPSLPLAVGLTLWTGAVYLATVWRSRIVGETQLRIEAFSTVDPLTGLATGRMFQERVRSMRRIIQRYGHPSVLMLVQIENLSSINQQFGPEAAEAAVLTGAARLRECLTEGDIAARVAHSRFAVLAEDVLPAEGAAQLASKILVAGLKEHVPSARSEFLQFRVVLAPLPMDGQPISALLQRLGHRMDEQLREANERRILTLSEAELLG